MADIAGWIALIATSIAAVMTAANLGPRVTGWGFAVFALGAAAWVTNGLLIGQPQLTWSNAFLGLVDLIGVWRWLGLRAKAGDAAKAEEERSAEDLFSVAKLVDLPVVGHNGTTLARVADALAHCDGGGVAYLIIREGGVAGIGETLRRLPWEQAKVSGDMVATDLDVAAIRRLSVATAG